eukprot:CAMPEP_0182421850 /NCGR_PEP_ID=MMETSP1167-20130531/7373_1 /TAXON_ID=2988 /ORGANISM="Mallomonas Sp, Strain CCMP3275" /LENGTH=343 /DNA_ID=CAMNT_0024599395 /DNA_START=209 /DNA_END=1240 /DNA_ORIENTATION=-
MNDDIGNILNAAASDTLDALNAAASNVFESEEQSVDDVFNDVANEMPNESDKPKRPRQKGKYGILKQAAEEASREGAEQAGQLMKAAASTLDVDALMKPTATTSETSPELDVGQILANEAEDMDNVGKILEQIGEEEYDDDEFFAELDALGVAEGPPEPVEEEKSVSSEDSEKDEEEEEEEEELETNPEDTKELRHMCYNGELSNLNKKLKHSGVSVIGRDSHGWTSLHWAASQNQYEILETLLSYAKKEMSSRRFKTYLNSADELSQWTALHVSCVLGHKNCVEVLLRFDAKKKLKNKFGESAAECVTLTRQSPDGRVLRRMLGMDVIKTSKPKKKIKDKER